MTPLGSRGGWLLVLPRAGGRVPLPAGSLGWELAFPAGETPQRSDKGMGVRVPPFVLGSWCTRLRRQKPLDARLAGGWSGINAPRGLRPRRGPSLGGGQSDKVPPPPSPPALGGRGRSLLVRGWLDPGGNSCSSPVRCGWGSASPACGGAGFVGGLGGRICPSRAIGAPFGVIFGAGGWK